MLRIFLLSLCVTFAANNMCGTKKHGVCVPDRWSCPYAITKRTPFGCPMHHTCCIPQKEAPARNITKCWTRMRGMCVPVDSGCPFPKGSSRPFGCPRNHTCCVPARKAPARNITSGCGFPPLFKSHASFRIIGGYGMRPGEFPWQVLLRMRRPTSFNNNILPRPFCGGSIIDKNWVLTAAHCFGESSPIKPNRKDLLRVVTGVTKIADSAKKDSKLIQLHEAEEIIMHAGYDPNTDRNDIALIKLARPIQFNNYSAPVCLPRDKENFQHTICTVSGWGIINSTTEAASSFLRGVNIPVISTRTCREIHHAREVLNVIFKTNLCTLFAAGGRDACGGDSGGPLACRMNSGQYILSGIVSWGVADGCGMRNIPGVYTQVSDYIDWIENITKIDFPS